MLARVELGGEFVWGGRVVVVVMVSGPSVDMSAVCNCEYC